MHRCFINPSDWQNSDIVLSAEEAHHLLNVMRGRVGDIVIAFDGRGREAETRIKKIHPPILEVCSESMHGQPISSLVTLMQALPKGKNMDLIVEKATELGVTSIIPVITERVIGRIDDTRRAEKTLRWQKLALSAAKQCGSCWVPEIGNVVAFETALQYCPGYDLVIIGSLHEGAIPLRNLLRDALIKSPRKTAMMIGPEGDFTPEEIRCAVSAGAIPARFGKLVLRVETAAIYAMSALVYELATG